MNTFTRISGNVLYVRDKIPEVRGAALVYLPRTPVGSA